MDSNQPFQSDAPNVEQVPNGTIHIIDDDEIDREFLAFKLRAHRFQVTEYASAVDFLNQLAVVHPVGCLVLDLQMPALSGLELQEKLREENRQLPIVFLSGLAQVSDATAAMKNGALDLMEKPPNIELLCDTLRRGLILSAKSLEAKEAEQDLRARLETLTPREREILPYVYAGYSLKEITAKFEFTFATAARHQNRILEKCLVANPTQLVRRLQDSNIEIEAVSIN